MSKTKKKPYSSPSLVELDASVAKEILETKGDQKDPIVQKMLSFADKALTAGQVKGTPKTTADK